ncbi:MAG: hypothetical protein FWF00_02430 [Endomicrobia bacterium]|nr:hypothetical protein [Endomicrobiia bacterium]MCL2506533.1 hypothetical protein [Endomicrobiia bacterium]
MKNKFLKNILYILLFILFSSSVHAGDLVNKKYREQFLSPEAVSNYYKMQVKVSNYFSRQTSAGTGLIESFKGSSINSYDMFTNTFIPGARGSLDSQSFTYDGAIAALSYLVCGQPKKAHDILNVYRHEFYRLKYDDSFGLFNSYRTDKKGFQGGLVIGVDGDRMHVGPTAWVAIAALQYTAATGKLDFLPFIIDVCKWIENIPHYTLKDGQRGAVSMGSGWGPNWAKTYSTENIVGHYALLKMLKQIYDVKDDKIKKIFSRRGYSAVDMNKEMRAIERWLMEVVYDKNKKTFNVGVNEKGVDKVDALDTISWTIPALGPKRLAELGVDPFLLMQFADKHYLIEDVIGKEKVRGYDFTNYEGRRKNYKMVWFEGTGFHIVAMQVMAKYSHEKGNAKRADYFRQKAIYFLNEMDKASALCGMVDGALPYTSKKPGEKQIFTSFRDEWEIPRGKKGQWVSSASSTGWYMLAASAFNPLGFDRRNVNYKLFK